MTKLKASKHIPLFTTNCYLENNRRQENTIHNGEKENLRLLIACGKYEQIEERRKAGVVQYSFYLLCYYASFFCENIARIVWHLNGVLVFFITTNLLPAGTLKSTVSVNPIFLFTIAISYP